MVTPTRNPATHALRHPPGPIHHGLLPHWLTQMGGLGLFAVAILDSSPIPLPLPGSTDLLLLLLVAHHGNPLLLAACAIGGSAIGGYITWSAGKKGGEGLLRRSMPPLLHDRVERWTDRHSILSVMLPALLPPPIPLTPFLLAAGALGVSRRRFLVAYNSARVLRYSLVSWAAVVYGRKFVHWWTNNLAQWSGIILWSFVTLLVGGTIWGIWQYRKQRKAAEPNFAQLAPNS